MKAVADGAATAQFPIQIRPTAARASGMTAVGLAVAALVLFGLVVAGASSPPPAATGTSLTTTTIGGITVLTNAKGFTLDSVRPRHPGHIQVLRELCSLLAPGDRRRRGQPPRAGPGRHDPASRRL